MSKVYSDNIFQGIITAIITPFSRNKLDFIALSKILEQQLQAKVNAILVAGTTGEGSSLNINEYEQLIRFSCDVVQAKIPIIAGCCSSSTNIALELALLAQKLGASGLMCTMPPYIKPTAIGIYQHCKAIHDAITIPIMLYNNPARTGVDMTDDTIINLAALPRIMALKDAGNNFTRPMLLRTKIKENFHFLAGDDIIALAYNAQGGVGCVSVTANVAPKLCQSIQNWWQIGDRAKALSIHNTLGILYKALSLESNPIPVKYCAHYLGLCENELRLPLLPLTDKLKQQVIEEAAAKILW